MQASPLKGLDEVEFKRDTSKTRSKTRSVKF
jgi:hypothetical protein